MKSLTEPLWFEIESGERRVDLAELHATGKGPGISLPKFVRLFAEK